MRRQLRVVVGVLCLSAVDPAPFDQHKIVFSPKGDLLQLSYAAEAVARSAPMAAIKTPDGVCLVALKTVPTAEAQLRDFDRLEKLSMADTHVAVGACGLKPDSLLIRSLAMDLCSEHRRQFDEPIPLLLLANKIADLMHEFTQGLNRGRPLGTSVLVAGWDAHSGVQLYQVASTGAVTSWKAVCLGLGSSQVERDLETEVDHLEAAPNGASLSLGSARDKLLKILDTAVEAKGYQKSHTAASKKRSGDVSYAAEVITLSAPPSCDEERVDSLDGNDLLILSPGQRDGERVQFTVEANAR